uniref:Interleukin-1 n=1 Tax=Pseudonaja textilis TaxID=8673 RepID=A0A670YWG6_PSETE
MKDPLIMVGTPFIEQLIAVLPNNALEVRKQAIFMGIQPNTVINCVQTEEGQLQLHGDIMYLYKQNEKFLNFSFYSKTDGSGDTCSFKSAQFPGWFLSIYSEAHKPIGLSPKGGPENILFHFQRILSQKFYFQREMEKISGGLSWPPFYRSVHVATPYVLFHFWPSNLPSGQV